MNLLMKSKKKTTLRKQWSRNIMALITVLFLGFGFFIYKTVNMAAHQMLTLSLDGMGKMAARELSQYDIKELIDNNDISKIDYNSMTNTLQGIIERTEDILPNIYIFAKNSSNNWIYVADASKQDQPKLGEAFPYDNIERDLVYDTMKVHITKIEQDFISQEAYVAAYIPIVQNDEVVAILGIDVNADVLIRLQMILLGVLVVIMVISLFIIWWIVRFMTMKQSRSIERLVLKMKEMTELKGDLTKRIDIEENNEIGELAMCTNQMLDTIQNLLLKVDENSKHLLNNSKHFSRSFEQVNLSFKEVNSTVNNVTDRIIGQTDEMSKMTGSIGGMHQAINEIAEYSQQVTIEASHTQTNAIKGNESIKNMKNQIENVGRAVKDTTELMMKLDQHSNEINSIVDAITAIARQTNLLALNASIEAARAGEHGRGFVVVADEVRTLAEESSKSAGEISKLLGEIRGGIKNASKSMKDLTLEKEASDLQVEDVMRRFESITASIQQVSSMVEEVSASTQEITSSTAIISDGMESLELASEENSASVEVIATSIDNEAKTINDLSQLVVLMEAKSNELNASLSELKLK
ncbi:methyl-accepting chemotaxis protein [Alkaliphilus peptidifermentans]|uniref:Methyl-accepting chemotaxis protein n=1 Tax=Alkaliphilus peptidifermentans DSM 18978 TaxID=1120976 RepID=A0A1G5IHB7_9FIRM|nr:methyl-accepting chemotaxis protein [Alkaliphilus peptidifermentans]SCY75545.1 Methyl-accepting chemotaxis protein [Alkaliphilus peptidifermentans DSM 18978]